MQLTTIVSVFTLFVTTSVLAGPVQGSNVFELEKRGCPSNQKKSWQGGGCETDWKNHKCQDVCLGQAQRRRDLHCCPGQVDHNIENHGCVWGWATCECSCYHS